MTDNQSVPYYVGALITSVLGGILLVVTDFAGWDGSNYYLGIYEEGWVGIDAGGPLAILIFGGLAAALFYSTGLSVFTLMNQDSTLDRKWFQLGILLAIAVAIISLIGGLYFVVSMLSDEPEDWWLDAGFFGGVIGGALTAVFLYLAQRQDEATV
jgi:hypothetical protein